MKAELWVEGHQPVPLVPLSMLKIEPGDVIYIGTRVTAADPADLRAVASIIAGLSGQ